MTNHTWAKNGWHSLIIGVIPTAMEALLEVFLFSVLLTSGTSLKCETCIGIGKECTGIEVTCPSGHDTCSVVLTESSVGPVRIETMVKGCASSSNCEKGPIYANFGQAKTRGSMICCTGSTCGLAFPQLPPINTTANGKQCPACYALARSCTTEVAYCTGSENYCIEAWTLDDANLPGVDITMKGCTSEQMCSGLRDGINSLGKAVKGHCRAANKVSLVSGSVLLLSGLLVIKIF